MLLSDVFMLEKKEVNIKFNVEMLFTLFCLFSMHFLTSTVGKRFHLVFIYTVSGKLIHF